MLSFSQPWGQVKPPSGAQIDWGDPISNGLISCWLLNERAGEGRVYDSARTSTGTLTTPKWRPGKFGPALLFNGTTDVLTISSVPAASSFTFTAFIRLTASTGGAENQIFENGSDNIGIAVLNDKLGFWDGGFIQATTVFAAGRWYFVAVTTDGTTKRLYVNAVQEATQAYTRGLTAAASKIGNHAATRPFNGSIDNVRIFNRALRHSEITRFYTEPFAGVVGPRRSILSAAAVAAGGGPLYGSGALIDGPLYSGRLTA